MRNRLRLQHFYILEAGLSGIFFIQAVRLLIGLLYSGTASASLVLALGPDNLDRALPGIVDPGVVSADLGFLVYMIALPLLTLIFGRSHWFIVPAALLVALGRAFVHMDFISQTNAASLTVGAGLLYLTMLIRHRAQSLPVFFIIGLAGDQLFRAAGNTMDPTWHPAYQNIQILLSFVVMALSVATTYQAQRNRSNESALSPDHGLMPVWGGIGLGALLFLQLTLFSLPNAIGGRAGVDYTTFVPLTLAATLLPLVPWIRHQARAFIGTFDGGLRGWLWMLLIALFIVLGTRVQGLIGGVALVVTQFMLSLIWWWLVRPQAEKERNFTGLWMLLAPVIMALLLVGDIFTYEYAFVRPLTTDAPAVNEIVTSLLRGFRGMGFGLLLLGAFLAALPMTQSQRRIPWPTGSLRQSLLLLVLVLATSAGGAYLARPTVIMPTQNVDMIRVGTYNIHNGFNEFFHYDLEAIAQTISASGAEIVLLQEVDAGRVSSYGVDQSLWLGRRLGMDRRFYPTNEGLQGLAVLSKIPIVFDEGTLLSSVGNQTGLQRVQVRPDAGVITVYNTWLSFLLAAEDGSIEQPEQEQQRQLNEIFAIIAADHPDGNLGRMLLGGTFNNIPSSPLSQQLRDTGFVDPFAGLPLELSATLVRTGQRAQLDYLWYRQPLLATSAIAIDSHASDHQMAVIELQIVRR
jgi:endonuclease/exonuclease/phosphatase family metal-dependent hydrolase